MKHVVFAGMFFGSMVCASSDQGFVPKPDSVARILQGLQCGSCPHRRDWHHCMPWNELCKRIKEDKASLRVENLLAPDVVDAHAATIAQFDLVARGHIEMPSSPVTVLSCPDESVAATRKRRRDAYALAKEATAQRYYNYYEYVAMREGSDLRSGSLSRCDGSPNNPQGLRRLGTLETAPSSPSPSTSTSRAVSPVPAAPTADAVRYAPKPRRDEQSKVEQSKSVL